MRDGTAARESEPRTTRHALELVRGKRSVDGHHSDAAAGLRAPVVGRLAEELTDRNAVHDKRRRWIEVREDENADGAADRGCNPAGGPDAGLVALRHHPGPCADSALGDGSACGGSDRVSDVLGLDLHDPSLREPAVVALSDDRDDEVLRADARLDVHGHANRAVVDTAHGMG